MAEWDEDKAGVDRTEEWCDFCDLAKATCPHGNPGVDDQPAGYRVKRDCTEGEDGPTIEANIPGECVACGDPIEPGDWITHIAEGWVHSPAKEQSRPPSTDTSMFDGVE